MAYRIIPIFVSHEGCPHACVFCNQKKIASSHHVTAEDVKSILKNAFDKTDCTGAEVAFYGGSFTAIPPQRQTALLESVSDYIKTGQIASVRISTRPDCIDEETLQRLKQYRVKTIELGVQSMCDDVLDLSNRGHTALDVEKATVLIRKNEFVLGLQVMTGLPGDTWEKTVYTAEKTVQLRPDFVRIYPVAVIADTMLCEMWRQGTYTPLTVEQAADRAGEMFRIFLDAGIDVIRIGLNPTEDLSSGGVLAGGYHPALGEMARSRVYRQRAAAVLSSRDFGGQDAILYVGPGDTSLMVGVKRENINYLNRTLQETCRFRRLLVRTDPMLARYEVRCE